MEPWLLVQEITHRAANEYAADIGSISLAAARCANTDAKAPLTGAARRLLDYADALRALQQPVAIGPADLRQYLRELCGAIVRASLAERNMTLTLIEESIELETEPCWCVGMIVSELIRNAVRHGLRVIVVELATQGGAVQCRVTDDGISIHPKPGCGVRIARALTLELRGDIDWHFGPRETIALLCFFPGR
jgi:two-component sensor histidine kinase